MGAFVGDRVGAAVLVGSAVGVAVGRTLGAKETLGSIVGFAVGNDVAIMVLQPAATNAAPTALKEAVAVAAKVTVTVDLQVLPVNEFAPSDVSKFDLT